MTSSLSLVNSSVARPEQFNRSLILPLSWLNFPMNYFHILKAHRPNQRSL